VLDHHFIAKHTHGYEHYVQNLQQYTVAELAADCGVPVAQIQAAAKVLAQKKNIVACWAMGLTQHKNAVDTIKEVVNLLLMKGSIGKPGAGTCPVRGHSNVQGDRTMGIFEQPSPALLQRLQEVYGFIPPQHHGFDTVNSIRAMLEGRAKVFMAMGGNFLSATPDTNLTAQALHNCALTVHVSTKLNRSHLVHGKEALILPCLGRTDMDMISGERQFVTCENSMGVIQMSKGNLEPVSDELLSEPVIICRLAKALLENRSKVSWDVYEQHYDHIRNDIEKVIPGFDNYNERVRHPGGFYLPNTAREGRFNILGSGKAHFSLANISPLSLAADEYVMMTIRSHDQFNTTIYGLDDRYRGVYNERRVILMNEKDIQRAGLKAGDVVDLINEDDGQRRVAHRFIVVVYNIPERNTATYFPETNVLVPLSSVAEKSNTPVSKMVIIKIMLAEG